MHAQPEAHETSTYLARLVLHCCYLPGPARLYPAVYLGLYRKLHVPSTSSLLLSTLRFWASSPIILSSDLISLLEEYLTVQGPFLSLPGDKE